jgi:hypothetical protein
LKEAPVIGHIPLDCIKSVGNADELILQAENTIELTVAPLTPNLLPKWNEQKWRNSIMYRKSTEYGQKPGPFVVYLRAPDKEECKDWISKLNIATG